MIKWTPKSQLDLQQIQKHIETHFDKKLAVEKVINIVETVDRILSENPLAGSVLSANPLFSKLVIEGNSIYYCENSKDKHLYIVYVEARLTVLDKSRISGDDFN